MGFVEWLKPMAIRRLRSDTLVRTLETRYRIELNARGDMKLGNLLRKRGFDSWSQFLKAYRGQATSHARRRRVFLSFHAEDLRKVRGLRLMATNPNVEFELYDEGLAAPVRSDRGSYIRSRIRPLIDRSHVLVCLIGNGTAWREWVDWEVRTAYELRKGICGVRLKGSRGRVPDAINEVGAPVWSWGVSELVAAVEQAAAQRS